jgi:pimeloyl-ACP methyl ester carboxylesterase
MHAGLTAGVDLLHRLGYGLLVVSRPGYGRTRVGPMSPGGFSALCAELCDVLGITSVSAVLGFSAGGLQAVDFAARYPDRAQRLVLQSAAPSTLRWPDSTLQRRLGPILFGARAGPMTWAITRAFLRRTPALALRCLATPLTVLPINRCVDDLNTDEAAAVRALFMNMNSGRGFAYDLHHFQDAYGDRMRHLLSTVGCPTLVMSSQCDGAVEWQHALSLTEHIPGAELYASSALWHFLWWGSDSNGVARALREFLARHQTDVSQESSAAR